MRQHGQCPRRAGQGARLFEEAAGDRVDRDRFRPAGGDADDPGAMVVVGQRLDAQRLQGAPVVLLGVVEGGAGGLVERAQGGEFPAADRRQDDHAVLIGHQHRRFDGGPRLFQLFQADLDDGHAQRAVVAGQRRGQVITRLAARGADAEEAPVAVLQRLAEVGAEGEVFAEEAVRPPPVAGGEHLALGVHDVDRQRAGTFVELFQVGIDAGAIAAAGQQVDDFRRQAQGAGQEGVFADLAFKAGGVQVQPVQAGRLQVGNAQALADAVGRKAAQADQQQADEEQRQGTETGHRRMVAAGRPMLPRREVGKMLGTPTAKARRRQGYAKESTAKQIAFLGVFFAPWRLCGGF